ncbi:MAG: PAAR domain-containing protein [Alphaproteobacteria bacterium]|nr:PAAR domain-containing protein [Alphaproteobacteria bacterium]
MPMPAARMAVDMHACTLTMGLPAGPIQPPCAVTVITGGMPQARMTDRVVCPSVPLPPPAGVPIVMGSPTVLVNNLPAARLLDPTACGGMIAALGCLTVIIGP